MYSSVLLQQSIASYSGWAIGHMINIICTCNITYCYGLLIVRCPMKDTVISKRQQYQTCESREKQRDEKCWPWDTTIGIMPATP